MNALFIQHFQTISGHLWHIYGYFVVIVASDGYNVATKQHQTAYKRPYMVCF